MQDKHFFPVMPQWSKSAYITAERYEQMYTESISQPDRFWGAVAEQFTWKKKWEQVKQTCFNSPVSVAWFDGGKLNITRNCLDRHLPQRAGQTAIIWEGDNPDDSRRITYQQLYDDVCRFANVLKNHGVKKGDRVSIYLPMIPEAAVAMLACARLGAVHSVVFGGFSADALKGRIEDCGSKLVITADEGLRGGKSVPLKANVDAALVGGAGVSRVIVVKHTGGKVAWQQGRDLWYHEEMAVVPAECADVAVDSEDPLFILYTSGSTGKPKGVLHTTAGYMVWASVTHKYTFDYRDGDIFWCTADVGWITGHTYGVYGPLLNGATVVMFEGIPNYPDSSRFWQIIDKYKVTIFHTAPTAIRALMREGDEPVKRCSLASLRLIGSVGEPINPEAWLWYWRTVGKERCPIVDTWWQTETGGNMIAPMPGAFGLKPGSATKPFFGVRPVIVDQQGVVQEGACEGMLCIADSWPGQARTILFTATMRVLSKPIFRNFQACILPVTAQGVTLTVITGLPGVWMMC
jgi:acetyl-CoA synthetase